jgi:hypothetical protein
VQLLQQLLPRASARGWSSVKALEAALAPVDRGGELVFEINVDEILAELLIEKAGRPEEEPVEDAMARYGRQRRAEREAAYARMEPEHRAAHELKDALAWDERGASAWLPVLQALEASGCPEVADAWVEYARRVQGPKRNAKRALAALCRALELHLAASDVTRVAVDEAVTWVSTTCVNANLPDELIEAYRAFGPRLAALPPCGQCGDLTAGCLSGGACSRADLASGAAWAPFHVDLDADENEDPKIQRRSSVEPEQSSPCSQQSGTLHPMFVSAPSWVGGLSRGGGATLQSPSGKPWSLAVPAAMCRTWSNRPTDSPKPSPQRNATSTHPSSLRLPSRWHGSRRDRSSSGVWPSTSPPT